VEPADSLKRQRDCEEKEQSSVVLIKCLFARYDQMLGFIKPMLIIKLLISVLNQIAVQMCVLYMPNLKLVVSIQSDILKVTSEVGDLAVCI
jgi:hypothetical protein